MLVIVRSPWWSVGGRESMPRAKSSPRESEWAEGNYLLT